MRLTLIALALVLVACGQPQQRSELQPDLAAAAQIGETQRLPSTLPPAGATPRFVGRWSATAEGCADPAWIFHADQMRTAGEVGCTLDSVRAIPAGYQIAATCSEEEDSRHYRMQVTFAESARAMMIVGGPWSAPTSLVYCGQLPGP